MLSGGNLGLQLLSIIILILAKRDGIILLLIILAMTSFIWILFNVKKPWRELFKSKQKVISIVIGVSILPICYFILRWTPIKDNSMYDILVKILNGFDLSILFSQSIQIASGAMITLLLAIILRGFRQFSTTGLVIVTSAFCYIILSALALTVLSQPNEGTISRKLMYIFMPCLLILFANNWGYNEKHAK
jgi:hypothetical protein